MRLVLLAAVIAASQAQTPFTNPLAYWCTPNFISNASNSNDVCTQGTAPPANSSFTNGTLINLTALPNFQPKNCTVCSHRPKIMESSLALCYFEF